MMKHVFGLLLLALSCASGISAAESAAEAKAILVKVEERYRTLPTSHFELTLTSRLFVVHEKIYYQPPDKLRVESDREHVLHLTILDGTLRLTVIPGAGPKAYQSEPQGKFELPANLVFSGLDQIPGVFQVTGREPLNGVDCVVVQVRGDSTWTYWIDENYLVRRYSISPGMYPYTVAFTVVQLGYQMKSDLFTYDPNSPNRSDWATNWNR
jgi:outer membrane lipoprotein-sorting protein